MTIFIAQGVTYRHVNGTLSGGSNLRALARNILSVREFRAGKTALAIAERCGFVPYTKAFLDEPELDHRIISGTRYMINIVGKFPVCHPKTVQILRAMKEKTAEKARQYGMEDVAREFLSPSMPVGTRARAYVIFNELIDWDSERGKNYYHIILNLLPPLRTDLQRYQDLIQMFWILRRINWDNFFRWPQNQALPRSPFRCR